VILSKPLRLVEVRGSEGKSEFFDKDGAVSENNAKTNEPKINVVKKMK